MMRARAHAHSFTSIRYINRQFTVTYWMFRICPFLRVSSRLGDRPARKQGKYGWVED